MILPAPKGKSKVVPAAAGPDKTAGQRPSFPEAGSPVPDKQPAISIPAKIGLEIRNLRKSLNLTLAELSAASKLSESMLSKIETGSVSPSLKTLDVIAKALNVPFKQLFART
jgi:DNA-binding XRE family transcriptional regulator